MGEPNHDSFGVATYIIRKMTWKRCSQNYSRNLVSMWQTPSIRDIEE